MMTQRYVYVVISKTATRFGYVLRRVGGVHYNHAAIALDEELKELYSFARKQYHAALIGGLVEETVERYTLRKQTEIPVTVFQNSIYRSNRKLRESSRIRNISITCFPC